MVLALHLLTAGTSGAVTDSCTSGTTADSSFAVASTAIIAQKPGSNSRSPCTRQHIWCDKADGVAKAVSYTEGHCNGCRPRRQKGECLSRACINSLTSQQANRQDNLKKTT
eukprot:TRINITY_DN23565_c0_g5_i1.p1 TRINITY_DN23565_c0_g5~~TRINITY_DN23565_c0_g5_i1.p1  ORF type:complete len:111 (+),score=1.88 TRINITY_DN23565_c0_g5_i1:358-690(+)